MRIRIFDTTLRDGEQTPGISLSPSQKLAIAEKLDWLGVDVIEAGFPVISDGEMEAVRMISGAGLSCDVCGLARANRKDIDAIVSAGLNYVHTFIATSDLHLRYKLKMDRQTVVSRAIDAVEYAVSLGLQVEFSAEDATRTDRKFLAEVFAAVTEAGAARIDIPDTVGYSTPAYMADITREAISATGLPVSVHCHNDFGLAVANAISGIEAGAECAHVTINGIGERAGNASLEELAMALKCLQYTMPYQTGIVSERIYETSKFVSHTVGMQVQSNKAIVGENAFGHESGIHTHGILSNPLTYEPIGPELVGRQRWLKVGKHAGIHGTNAILAEYGIHPNKDESQRILEQVKERGDMGKLVTEVELLNIANDVMDDYKIRRLVQISGFSVSTGVGTMPYAFVRLNIDGREYMETDHGVGPVDAAFNAIQKIIDPTSKLHIKDYALASISGGSTALCEVTVQVSDSDGNVISAKSVGGDIVTTSVHAVIEGANHLLLKKMLHPKVDA